MNATPHFCRNCSKNNDFLLKKIDIYNNYYNYGSTASIEMKGLADNRRAMTEIQKFAVSLT